MYVYGITLEMYGFIHGGSRPQQPLDDLIQTVNRTALKTLPSNLNRTKIREFFSDQIPW